MVCRLSSCGVGSVVAVRGLSCLATCGILVPPPGIGPTSPALEGGFLTTGPPGQSRICSFRKARLVRAGKGKFSTLSKVSFYLHNYG